MDMVKELRSQGQGCHHVKHCSGPGGVVHLRSHIEAFTGMRAVVTASSESHAKSRQRCLHHFKCTMAMFSFQFLKLKQIQSQAVTDGVDCDKPNLQQ